MKLFDIKRQMCIASVLSLTRIVPSSCIVINLQNDAVEYGKTVCLFCSFMSAVSNSSWYWFVGSNLTFVNSNPVHPKNKYLEEMIDNTRRKMTINHFDFSDVTTYRCSHAFETMQLDLSKISDTFIYFGNLTEKVVSHNEATEGEMITVHFKNINPVPDCVIKVENVTVQMNPSVLRKMNYLLDVNFVAYLSHSLHCNSPTRLICNFGGKPYLDDILPRECKGIYVGIYIILSLLMVVLLTLLPMVYCIRKHHNKKQVSATASENNEKEKINEEDLEKML